VRFVSELGAQAVPDSADFMEPERWPALDWDRLRDHHALQPEVLDRHVPVGAHATFGSWREASQRYQATVLRHQVEALRRVKYRPTGGFCMFLLADAQPAVSWSVLDHERVPKLGFHALTEACRPVIVVADRLPAAVAAGQALALDVHVVNDLHHGLDGARVTATLTWPTGSHHWCWEGDVPADDCIRIGTIQFVVPDTLEITDLVVVDLTLEADDVVATNRDVTVVAGPE
jgi:beta-mannosidase